MVQPIIAFASQAAWETWLDEHHSTSDGLRLKFAKKGSGIESVSPDEAVEVALCYGWIDSQANRLDDAFWMMRFTPRRSRSKWSQVNRARAEALIAQDAMMPAGLLEVERAKADGRWDAAYAAQSQATVPEDLQRELDQNPEAQAFFDTLDSRNRYAILHRLHDAKKPETRARRIEKFVAMLRTGQKIYL